MRTLLENIIPVKTDFLSMGKKCQKFVALLLGRFFFFFFRVLGTEMQPKAKNDTPKYEVLIKSDILKILELGLASFK